MRVVIFDGILETHVASSLERAFIRRGHQVLNTGKIGSGFKFPSKNADLSHIESAIYNAIEFKPDFVFVMRPCSLPPKLLNKFKQCGATFAAWFSDDPVLFDLSYGPVVDLYDLVYHCGNKKVLDFYESRFGRATGVNLPFWTDHESFPVSWGTREPNVDFMFLGNVQDEVRRTRYFELGQLAQSVRVHGNVGADYFGISGGYLDSDREVCMSGATAKVAINIPQFFENHRGLDTWFTGLGDLGFFEYPSRVVQYMAMGIPTISIIPDGAAFKSYPEMLVANSIDHAGELFCENEAILGELSQQVVGRFDKNFSADSRVLAIESSLMDEAWRQLDSAEREIWFTQFVPDLANDDKDDKMGQPSTARIEVAEPSVTQETGKSVAKPDLNVVICGDFSVEGGLTRADAIADLFEECAAVRRVSISLENQLLVKDPGGICDFALNVPRLDLETTDEVKTLLVVVCRSVALTGIGRQMLSEAGVYTVAVDDTELLTDAQRKRTLESFGLVAFGNLNVYNEVVHLGNESCVYLPLFPSPKLIAKFEAIDRPIEKPLRIRETRQVEESVSPCFSQDFSRSDSTDVLETDNLGDLAEADYVFELRREVSLLSFGGTRNRPRLSQTLMNAVAGSELAFFSRASILEQIAPFHELCVLASNPGELSIKTKQFHVGSLDLAEAIMRQKDKLCELSNYARQAVSKLMAFATQEIKTTYGELLKGATFEIPFSDQAVTNRSTNSSMVVVKMNFVSGSLEDWWLRIRLNGKALYGQHPNWLNQFLLKMPVSHQNVKVELEYLGADRTLSSDKAISVTSSLQPQRRLFTASDSRNGTVSLI